MKRTLKKLAGSSKHGEPRLLGEIIDAMRSHHVEPFGAEHQRWLAQQQKGGNK